MNKVLEKIQAVLIAIFLLLIVLKPLRIPGVNMLFVILPTLLVLLLYFVAFYQLISKWKYSKSLGIMLFFFSFIEAAAVIGVMFSLMFWNGAYIMTLSSMKFYIFGFFLILLFFLLSKRKIIPFKNYEASLKNSEQVATVSLKFEWIKFMFFFLLGLFIHYLPIETRVHLFASNPERDGEKMILHYKQEKENFDRFNKKF